MQKQLSKNMSKNRRSKSNNKYQTIKTNVFTLLPILIQHQIINLTDKIYFLFRLSISYFVYLFLVSFQYILLLFLLVLIYYFIPFISKAIKDTNVVSYNNFDCFRLFKCCVVLIHCYSINCF